MEDSTGKNKNFCRCGCGTEINNNRTFYFGHHKRLEVGPLNSSWKGGRKKDHYGYIWVNKPDHPFARERRVREHRLVWEEYHKAILLPWIHIHHINEIRDDNRIENLMPMTESEHHSHHRQGFQFSDETRRKLRLSHLGKKFSAEHRKNLSLAQKGKPRGKYRKKVNS